MRKQTIPAMEKHYIKLNNKLNKEIKELKLDKIKLIDTNSLLVAENESLRKTVKQQQEWITKLNECLQLSPKDFKNYVENLSKQVILEQQKQEQLQFVKEFITKFI